MRTVRDADESTGGDTSPAATSSPAASDAGTPLADRLEAEIAVEGSPDWPLAAFDSIWVLAPGPSPRGRLRDAEPHPDRSGHERGRGHDPPARPPVPGLHGERGRDLGMLRRCARPHRSSHERDHRHGPDQGLRRRSYRPAAGGGYLWFLGSGDFVADTVIALDTGAKSTRTFQQSGTVGGMAYAFDALWLTIPGEGAVVRFDPVTEETEVLTTDLPNPTGIVAGADSLWVSLHGANDDPASAGDTQLVRIDPESGEVDGRVRHRRIAAVSGVEAWAGDEAVYVRSTTPWMVRIDPATNEIVETITSDRGSPGPADGRVRLDLDRQPGTRQRLSPDALTRLRPAARPRSRPSRRGSPGAPVPTRTPP